MGNHPTGDLKAPTTWEAGRKYSTQQLGRSVAGSASLRLLNIEGKWNSIVRGNRVLIDVDGVARWGGYVDKARNRYTSQRFYRHLSCFGALALLRRRITIAPATSVSLQDAMTSIFDACNVPAALRGTISGTLTIPTFGADNEDGKLLAHALENSAQGFLHEQLDGAIGMLAGGATPTPSAISHITAEDFSDAFERDVDGYFTNPANDDTTTYQLARTGVTNPIYEEAPRHFLTNQSAIDTYLSWLLNSVQFATEIGQFDWFAASNLSLFTGMSLRDRLTYRTDLIYIVEAMRVRLTLGGKYQVDLTVARVSSDVVAPGVPTQLSLIHTGTTFLQANWHPPITGDFPTSYQLEWREGTSGDYTLVSNATTPYTLSGLSPGLTYQFRVRARNSGGDSAWTDPPVSGVTRLAPSIPSNLVITPSGGTNTVTWDAPIEGDPPFTYELEWRRSSSDDWTNEGTQESGFVLSGQARSTRTYFRVRAINTGGIGPWDEVSYYRPALPPAPPAPTGLTVTQLGNSRVKFGWTASPGASGYSWQVLITGGGTQSGATTSTSVTRNLTNATGGTFRVLAAGSGGNSAWASKSFTVDD